MSGGWIFAGPYASIKKNHVTPRSHRLEWISLVYLAFFVLAVLSPSLYTRSFFGVSEITLEELTIFTFGIAGLMTFTFYERYMERREKEQEYVQNEYQRAKAELMESYAYIGSINRKIELLKKLAQDTSSNLGEGKRLPKELFHSLAANACAAAGADVGLLRFIELDRLRTGGEFAHDPEVGFPFRISNRALREVHEQGLPHTVLKSEDQQDILVVPSDQGHGPWKAYLLLHPLQMSLADVDTSLLKIFVNQAEVLYRNLMTEVAH